MQLSLETQQAGCLTPRPQGSRPLPGQPRWAMCGCLGCCSLPRAPTPPEQLAPLGAAGSHPAPSPSPWDAASSAVHPLVPLPCCSPAWRQLSPSRFFRELWGSETSRHVLEELAAPLCLGGTGRPRGRSLGGWRGVCMAESSEAVSFHQAALAAQGTGLKDARNM